MDVASAVSESELFAKLGEDPELQSALLALRSVAGSLAETVSRSVPDFTDHTLRHMDALWSVADQVLTADEVSKLSTGEAFVLACSFYLHDIGMAYAATAEGLARIEESSPFRSYVLAAGQRESEVEVRACALAYAVRMLHASAAEELASAPVPGTDIYLLERPVRDAWGEVCGQVAASHHWSLEKIEQEFGGIGRVPLPGGRTGDLAFVASVLRIVDYAHMNRERADKVDRAFRLSITPESVTHWLAQENIDGPVRDGADLVFHAASPIANVDAWWLYFEMLKGLDEEIRTVRRYLDRRSASHGRLSLQGVRGVTSPEEAASLVPTSGFLPIEINLRTGSIERLVQLLAGESLYGPDPMAAVRELVQNARDAVSLKAAVANNDFEKAALSIPIRLSLRTTESPARLEITDPGIGMTRKVMTDFLISIASDYWATQLHSDFPDATRKGFQPAGKFGIGFLSVFMLGDEVTVESNRGGGERHRMHLRGVGRRGEIRPVQSPSGSGTAVRVTLRDSVADSLKSMATLLPMYAPMLPHDLEIDVDGTVATIPSGWIRELSAREFYEWVTRAADVLTQAEGSAGRINADDIDQHFWYMRHRRYGYGRDGSSTPGWISSWPEYNDDRCRLVGAFSGVSILALKGLAIQPIRTPGFVGVIDVENQVPDVSRRRLLHTDQRKFLETVRESIRPQIVENLNALGEDELLIDKLDFLTSCIALYGRETILTSTVRWISFLKLPGEVELVSCATLLERLTKSSSLFVAYGTGPWTAMKRWVALGAKRPELAIVLDGTPGDGLPYHSGRDDRIGKLSDLWPECEGGPIFGTVLRVAAEAWQASWSELVAAEGWRHSGSVLWGTISRP